MAKKSRHASQSFRLEQQKVPREEPRPPPRDCRFRWTTKHCDFEGEFSWSNVEHQCLLSKIIPKLQELEGKTWGEIETQLGHLHHFIEVDKLSRDAKVRLSHTEFAGVEDLFSVHVEARLRVWGVREYDLLRVLWYDPQHQVYPVVPGSDKDREARRKQRNRQSGSL